MSRKKSRNNCVEPSIVIDCRLERLYFKNAALSLIFKTAAVAAVTALVFTFIFGVSIQKGEGMYPRIRDGDLMLWYRLSGEYVTGEIVTLEKDGVRYTGRVVAIAGDTVTTSAEGKLIVNGAIQYEEIYYDTYTQGSGLSYPYTVPENSYFILGDMRTGATDSRDFGAASKSVIDGKIITIVRRRGL